jgi:chromosome partitioning protein
MPARVLAIANRKGGTGKSTIAVNLGAEFGASGHRVLVIDLDPQGHAGLGFGVDAEDPSLTVHAAFRDRNVALEDAIQKTNEPGVDVIAADRGFDGQVLLNDPRCLARAIEPLKPMYDVILIDSPPSAANLIVCALLAAEGVLVPTALDYLALDGVRQFARSYHHVMMKLHATLLGCAIAPMQVDYRANMQKLVLDKLLKGFGSDQVTRGVRTDVSVAEAFGHRRPLRQYRRSSRAVEDFRLMADDVKRRFNIS